MDEKANKLLDRITTPHQLKRLGEAELDILAEELRERIVEVVSSNGGHLASNLGIAELTIALHNVFDFSRDRLLWDVGHQCYAHKILTGRGKRFHTLRQAGGVSGFPNPSESPYDLFATGHAGTAISTAAGLAWADQALDRDTKVVAVVGDGSIANGLSLEGINNAAMLNRQFLIVLNDNSMAIDLTQGAMARLLDRVRMTHAYSDIKHSTENLLHRIPLGDGITEAIRTIKAGLRTTIHGGQAIEALGFDYFGPVDGHNIRSLIKTIQRLAYIDHPVLLHVHTEKGRGCQYAVDDPCRFHSPSAYTVRKGRAFFAEKNRPTWTQVFSDTIVNLADRDEKVVAITAAMPDGTGLTEFRRRFEDRYLDVGISESHAVAVAAGMAKAGMKPIVAIYSTFMQRAMDQVFEELALQKLPVVLCMDRAGLVGSDGAVHHGFMDISMLRAIPGMVLLAPADAAELPAAMELAVNLDCPSAIRYPRDEIPQDLPGKCPPFELGQARILRRGDDGTMLCYGEMSARAFEAAKILQRQHGKNITVVNARFAKPLDSALIGGLLKSRQPMLIAEDHSIVGGFGSAVLELANRRGLDCSHVHLAALPDSFIAHATRAEQLNKVALDANHLAEKMKTLIDHHASQTINQPM